MPANPKQFSEAGKRRLIFIMEKALVASFLGHFSFIALFLWLGIKEMALLNILSSISLLASIKLTRRQRFVAAFNVGTFEIVIHAILAVLYVGWSSGFHYYLIVLVPYLFFWPSWSKKVKIVCSVLLYVLYAVLFYYSRVNPSIYALPIWQSDLTSIINMFVAFASFAAVAMYFQMITGEVEQKLREANVRLSDLAGTDPLTELQNRRTIIERIGQESANKQNGQKLFSVIMADIDYFKSFNDKFGHQFGDQVLVNIANLLKSTTRSKDIVARWGGEEFLVLLPETPGEEAWEVADRMRMVISQTPLFLDGREIHISMTFGVAECNSSNGINECIAMADKALYKGKGNGRNQVVLFKSPISEPAT